MGTYQAFCYVERRGLGVLNESSSVLGTGESDVNLIAETLDVDLEQSSSTNSGSSLGVGDWDRGKEDHALVDLLLGLGLALVALLRSRGGVFGDGLLEALLQSGREVCHVQADTPVGDALDLAWLCCSAVRLGDVG